MTPKEQYEARKAERAKLKDLEYQTRQHTEGLMMMDLLDRFVTAFERGVDALERRPYPSAAASYVGGMRQQNDGGF